MYDDETEIDGMWRNMMLILEMRRRVVVRMARMMARMDVV
jgi:hypothetical protein